MAEAQIANTEIASVTAVHNPEWQRHYDRTFNAIERKKEEVRLRVLAELRSQAARASKQSVKQPTEPSEDTETSPTSPDLLQKFQPRKFRAQPVIPQAQTAEQRPGSKRPASPPNAYGDERRRKVSDLQKVPRKPPTTQQAPEATSTPHPVTQQGPPRWYMDTKPRTNRDRDDRDTDILIQTLRDQIRKCQKSTHSDPALREWQNAVRERLHHLSFAKPSGPLLRAARMLHNEDGLPQIFDPRFTQEGAWPFDIVADARELYNKWYRQDFDPDLMRGIKLGKRAFLEEKGTGDSIEPGYKGQIPAAQYGHNGLVNGQWWPLWVCALRDGAHGHMMQGISGRTGKGAFSCVISSGEEYDNVDNGDEVLYCGTDSTDGKVSEHTKWMLESVKNGRPVRFIRSHNLRSEYAPKEGLRYDGLYDVVSYDNVDGPDSLRQRHRFRLVRCAGQDPIRGGDSPATRPTWQEIEKYKAHRRYTGKK